jgi:hypothetical protein
MLPNGAAQGRIGVCEPLTLPGDDLVPSPLVETTHAVTINGVFSELAHLRGCVGCWTSASRLRGPPPTTCAACLLANPWSPRQARIAPICCMKAKVPGCDQCLANLVIGWSPLPRSHARKADQHHRGGGVNVNHTGPGAIPPRDWHVKQVGQQQPALVSQRDRQRRPHRRARHFGELDDAIVAVNGVHAGRFTPGSAAGQSSHSSRLASTTPAR